MNIRKLVLAVACCLSVPATVTACAADLTITYKVTDRDGDRSARYMSSMRTRLDHGPHTVSSGQVVGPYTNIVDMVLGKYVMIDHQKKEYYEYTPQQGEASQPLNGKVASVATYNYWVAPDLRDPSRTASRSFAPQETGLSSEYSRVSRELEDKGLPLAWIMTALGIESSSEAIDVKKGVSA
jgi:hypothetical protein